MERASHEPGAGDSAIDVAGVVDVAGEQTARAGADAELLADAVLGLNGGGGSDGVEDVVWSRGAQPLGVEAQAVCLLTGERDFGGHGLSGYGCRVGRLTVVTSARGDGWQPDQYARFKAEREQPFYDLLDLVEPTPGGRVVDLGCGTGALTRVLHERTRAAETVGVDRSEAMLEQSQQHAGDGVRFERGDIAEFSESGLDVVFANASIQWVAGHGSLFPRLASTLKPGGQLAVQMPANEDHPSHAVAREVAQESPHAEALGGFVYRHSIESTEWYAEQFARLGFAEQHVRLQVYLHRLPGPEDVIEWVKGSLLTGYRNRMAAADYEAFLADYRERLLSVLSDERPFLYPFKRVLLWGRVG